MAKKTDQRYFGDAQGASERRRLFSKIERLEGSIRMGRELVQIKESQLRTKREAVLTRLAQRMEQNLDKEALALASPESAAQTLFDRQLPQLLKKQRLAFREQRQNMLRAEQQLQKDGRKKPDAHLSQAAQAKLEALQKTQEQEQADLKARLLASAKARQLAEPERTARQKIYDQAVQQNKKLLQAREQALSVKDQHKLDAFKKRQLKKIAPQESQLTQLQAALIESDSHAAHDLPQDVVLRLDNLSMVFGGLRAVDKLSFDVKQGEIFGLIGPNGAGKTTVFNCITQFYSPTEGNILYRTKEGNVLRLNNYKVHDIITKGIVRTFQNVEVIAELSILDNLLIAAHKQFRSSLFHQFFNTRKVRQEEDVIRARAMQVLDYCGLTALKDLPPVGQPYGILKRIELARTLMAGAHLIILDEPAAGLNDQETIELTHLIRRIQKDYDATIFLVEHNMGLVMDLCDHICAISFGKKLAYGTPAEIQNDKAVQEAYLGTSDTEEVEAI